MQIITATLDKITYLRNSRANESKAKLVLILPNTAENAAKIYDAEF